MRGGLIKKKGFAEAEWGVFTKVRFLHVSWLERPFLNLFSDLYLSVRFSRGDFSRKTNTSLELND